MPAPAHAAPRTTRPLGPNPAELKEGDRVLIARPEFGGKADCKGQVGVVHQVRRFEAVEAAGRRKAEPARTFAWIQLGDGSRVFRAAETLDLFED